MSSTQIEENGASGSTATGETDPESNQVNEEEEVEEEERDPIGNVFCVLFILIGIFFLVNRL